eukprot:gnl/MRDRNA2_/MRDRNA2_466412_c0_seq1.p1 gnl/MRDRNA2_/MRDRNA2_466412_c0~~gnl/MRDRNA2_/MRDRNA2_466412_c0_seq1.p1  ORF type:complete len:101 (-),score=4.43 gnl/MRDRNA2_/MRDRNA2_466412_c0_seq1:13-315(-)
MFSCVRIRCADVFSGTPRRALPVAIARYFHSPDFGTSVAVKVKLFVALMHCESAFASQCSFVKVVKATPNSSRESWETRAPMVHHTCNKSHRSDHDIMNG